MNLVTGPWQEKMTGRAGTNVTTDDVLGDEAVACLEVVGVGDLVVESHPLALVLCSKRILNGDCLPGNFLCNLLLL